MSISAKIYVCYKFQWGRDGRFTITCPWSNIFSFKSLISTNMCAITFSSICVIEQFVLCSKHKKYVGWFTDIKNPRRTHICASFICYKSRKILLFFHMTNKSNLWYFSKIFLCSILQKLLFCHFSSSTTLNTTYLPSSSLASSLGAN